MSYLATVLQPREQPVIKELIGNLELAITQASAFMRRMEKNDRVRSCSWDGQSDDGRKHSEDLDDEAMPWEGASDQRIQLARMLIREDKLVCAAAMMGGRLQAVPIDLDGDPAAASAQAPLLKWLASGRMGREMRNQIDHLLDWRGTFGHSVMAVEWHQQRQLKEETLTRDELLQLAVDANLAAAGLPDAQAMEEGDAAGQMAPEAANAAGAIIQGTESELMAALLDPEKTDLLVSLIDALLNPEGQTVLSVPAGEIRRVVTALQRGEPGVYYRPWLCENRPKWTALLPFVDVFYPTTTTDLADAEWIARVHWLSESRLRDRAALEGWDGDWLAAVLKQPGQAFGQFTGRHKWALTGGGAQRDSLLNNKDDTIKQFQIVELFQKATAQIGVPCIYRTVLHPAVSGSCAIHEPRASMNGRYDFVDFRREREDSKYLLDCTGIPEDVMTHQNAIKAQHDARTNRTDLELMPPATVPMNRAGASFQLGPMAQIPVRRSGTISYMSPPPMSVDSLAISKAEMELVDATYGRFSPSVPPALQQLHKSKLAGDFLTDVSAVYQLTFQACLEYYDDATWQKITGQPKPAPDPWQQDIAITFDVRNLDVDWLRQIMELYTQFVVPNDYEGVIDRAGFVEYLFNAISPQVAARVIKPKDSAMMDETEDELSQLAIIMAGEEPPQKQGQNYGLRLQVLERALQRSQEINRKVGDVPQIAEVLNARMEFFRNQLGQQQNAIIGRTMQQTAMDPKQ